jgi:pimeloyl-ACP methyl ester carboxylesterase
VPVLVLHSRDDQLIPLELSAVALAPILADVEVHETSGRGHDQSLPVSDPEIQRAYLSFLDRLVARH